MLTELHFPLKKKNKTKNKATNELKLLEAEAECILNIPCICNLHTLLFNSCVLRGFIGLANANQGCIRSKQESRKLWLQSVTKKKKKNYKKPNTADHDDCCKNGQNVDHAYLC